MLANRVIQMLERGRVSVVRTRCAAAIGKNRTPAQNGWQEGLPDLEHRVAAIKTTLQELAWMAAEMKDEDPRATRN